MSKAMSEVKQELIAYTYEQARIMSAVQRALGDEDISDPEAYAAKRVAELLAISEQTAKESDWPEAITHAFCAGMITSVANMLYDLAQEHGVV